MRLLQIILIVLVLFTSNPDYVLSQIPEKSFILGNKRGFVNDFSLSPNNKVIVFPEGKTLHAYDLQSGKIIKSYTGGHNNDILCTDFSRDSSILVTGCREGRLVVWDIGSGEITQEYDFSSGPLLTAAISPDSRYIATGGVDGNIRIIEIGTGTFSSIYCGDNEIITRIITDDRSNSFYWSTSSGALFVMNLLDNKSRQIKTSNGEWIRDVCFDSSSERIVAVGLKKKIYYCSLLTGKIFESELLPEKITSISYTDDYSAYAVGFISGRIKFYIEGFMNLNLRVHAPVQRLKLMTDNSSQIFFIVATYGGGLHIIPLSSLKY